MILLRFCLLLLVLAMSAGCATVSNEEQASRATAHYKIGVAYLNEKKVQQAFVEFQRALELNPSDKEVLNAIGIVYLLHFSDTPKAISFFERATVVDKNYSEAWNNLGYAHETEERYETAISCYQKALANLLYATPEKAYISMGKSQYRLRKFSEAIRSYQEAIRRAPSLSLPYYGLALTYNATGKYGDAAAAMTQGLKLDPTFKGSREKAAEAWEAQKIVTSWPQQQDLADLIEILKY